MGLIATPFSSGKDTVFTVYFNANRWELRTKTWSIQEVSEEADDDVNGENFTRSQLIFQYWRVALSCYDHPTAKMIENTLTSQQAQRASLPETPIAAGAKFVYLDGATKKAITLNGCSRLPLKIDSPGRRQRVMYDIGFKATEMQLVTAT